MDAWADYYYALSVINYNNRAAARAQEHLEYSTNQLAEFAKNEWGITVLSEDIMGWVDYSENKPYMKGGNLNLFLKKFNSKEDPRITEIRNNLDVDKQYRHPGIYSIHMKPTKNGKPAYFQVDTFSGLISTPGNLLMHGIVDVFGGTFVFPMGLPGRGR